MFQLTPIVKNILIINGILLFLEYILKVSFAPIFGVHYIFSDHFYIFQYVTYMWLHGDIWHLVFNMFGVLVFGPMLERVWGSKRFLTYYLITGIGAGLLYGVADLIEKRDLSSDTEQFIANPDPDAFYRYVHAHKSRRYDLVKLSEFADEYFDNNDNKEYENQALILVEKIYDEKVNGLMIGASGALFGILIAFGMLFPNTELMLLFPPIPIKAKYLVFFYGAYALYNQINASAGDNVAHMAHLTGMLVGFLVLKYWQRQRGDFY